MNRRALAVCLLSPLLPYSSLRTQITGESLRFSVKRKEKESRRADSNRPPCEPVGGCSLRVSLFPTPNTIKMGVLQVFVLYSFRQISASNLKYRLYC
jgi:hypothetical protein